MTLDELFEKKNQIALEVQQLVADEMAANGNQTLFLPSGPSAVDDIRTQMLSALTAAGTTSTVVERTHDLEQVEGE